MRVLVTGADSFVGSYLIPELIKRSYDLFLIGADVNALEHKYDDADVLSYIGLEQVVLEEKLIFFKPEIVIHLAAYSTPNDGFEDYVKLIDANLLFLGKLLTSIINCPPKLFINTGSSFEYYGGDGILDPAYLYTATKTASRYVMKYYASAYGFKHCTVCPYSVYGGVDTRKKVLDIIRESLDAEEPKALSPGMQVMDFIHIADLVSLYLSIVDNVGVVNDNTTYHAGTGEGQTLRDVACAVEKISHKKANITWGALPYRPRDVMCAVADVKLQKQQFNWEATISFDEGITEYLKKHKVI